MSTNIAIHGQGTGMGPRSTPGNAPIIDRAFPGILSNKMSEGEWISFCNEVDKTLAPVGPIKGQIMGRMKMLACGMFASFAVIAGISISGVLTNSVGFYIYPVMFFSLPLGLFCFSNRAFSSVAVELNKCMKDLEEACERESARRHDVSFHVRGQTIGGGRNTRSVRQINYIECSVGGAGAGAGAVGNNNMTFSAMEAGQATPVAFPVGGPDINAPPAASSIFNNLAWGGSAQPTAPTISTATRLQELEGIKALISEEEYNTKKQDILNSI
jgi:hypothetical protein